MIKQDLYDKIRKRARTRKNGVYSFQGFNYAVRDGYIAFIEHYGQICQISHGVMVNLGKVERHQAKKELINLLISY